MDFVIQRKIYDEACRAIQDRRREERKIPQRERGAIDMKAQVMGKSKN